MRADAPSRTTRKWPSQDLNPQLLLSITVLLSFNRGGGEPSRVLDTGLVDTHLLCAQPCAGPLQWARPCLSQPKVCRGTYPCLLEVDPHTCAGHLYPRLGCSGLSARLEVFRGVRTRGSRRPREDMEPESSLEWQSISRGREELGGQPR